MKKLLFPLIALFLTLAVAGWFFAPSLPAVAALAKQAGYSSGDATAEIYQKLEQLGTDSSMGTLFDALQSAKNAKIDLDHRNAAGKRLVEVAASLDQGEASAAFIVAGSNINAVDANGDTVIHLAVRHHALHVLRDLRRFMPDLTSRNKDGLTPAELARKLNDTEALAILTAPFS
jgi:ankyrin repeat protein